jgi:hypothetical protein
MTAAPKDATAKFREKMPKRKPEYGYPPRCKLQMHIPGHDIFSGQGIRRFFSGARGKLGGSGTYDYCVAQRAACAASVGEFLRQCRAASISVSEAPWLRAHISAAEAEYLAT